MSKNSTLLSLITAFDPATMRFVEGRSSTAKGKAQDVIVMENDTHIVLITISLVEKKTDIQTTQDNSSTEDGHAE